MNYICAEFPKTEAALRFAALLRAKIDAHHWDFWSLADGDLQTCVSQASANVWEKYCSYICAQEFLLVADNWQNCAGPHRVYFSEANSARIGTKSPSCKRGFTKPCKILLKWVLQKSCRQMRERLRDLWDLYCSLPNNIFLVIILLLWVPT